MPTFFRKNFVAETTTAVEGPRLSELTINNGTRRQFREQIIHEFLKEEPGTGKGQLTSKYTYFVETLANGERVFLTRPARLNNGFDFEIRVEGMTFASAKGRTTNRPSHPVIFDDLIQKKAENGMAYLDLFKLIENVYNCNEISPKDYSHLKFASGMPVDMVLFIIKWLFIEQDVTYWNYSGRAMFMSGDPSNLHPPIAMGGSLITNTFHS
jgi:hypothetical protein